MPGALLCCGHDHSAGSQSKANTVFSRFDREFRLRCQLNTRSIGKGILSAFVFISPQNFSDPNDFGNLSGNGRFDSDVWFVEKYNQKNGGRSHRPGKSHDGPAPTKGAAGRMEP
jgi:hypothetical protein